MLDIDGLEGYTFQQILDDPSNLIPALTQADDLKAEANWWWNTTLRTTADNFGFSDVYSLITGKDFDNGQKVDRVRAFANLGVNTIAALTLHKTIKALPNAETPLEATMRSNAAAIKDIAPAGKKLQVGTYKEMTAANVGSGLSADHIPSFAALRANMEKSLGRLLTKGEETLLRNNSLTMAYETEIHQKFSRTYGGRNNAAQIAKDAENLFDAIQADLKTLTPALEKAGYSDAEIKKASTQILNQYKPK